MDPFIPSFDINLSWSCPVTRSQDSTNWNFVSELYVCIKFAWQYCQAQAQLNLNSNYWAWHYSAQACLYYNWMVIGEQTQKHKNRRIHKVVYWVALQLTRGHSQSPSWWLTNINIPIIIPVIFAKFVEFIIFSFTNILYETRRLQFAQELFVIRESMTSSTIRSPWSLCQSFSLSILLHALLVLHSLISCSRFIKAPLSNTETTKSILEKQWKRCTKQAGAELSQVQASLNSLILDIDYKSAENYIFVFEVVFIFEVVIIFEVFFIFKIIFEVIFNFRPNLFLRLS